MTKTLENEADRLCSKIIRAKGFCERCGSRYRLEAAHIISRGHHATRYDLDNFLCLCHTCHQFYTEHSLEFEAFVISKIGEAHYQELKTRAIDYKTINYKEVIRRLQESQQI